MYTPLEVLEVPVDIQQINQTPINIPASNTRDHDPATLPLEDKPEI